MAGLWLPDNRLVAPRAHGLEPTGPVRIDPANPFSPDLAYSWVFGSNGLIDVVRGEPMYYDYKHPDHRNILGKGAYFIGDNNSGNSNDRMRTVNNVPTLHSDSAQPAQTRIYVFTPYNFGGTRQYILYKLSDNGILLSIIPSTGQLQLGYDGDNGYEYTAYMPSGCFTWGNRSVVAISIDSVGQNIGVYVNGLRWADAASYVKTPGLIGGGTIPSAHPAYLAHAENTYYRGWLGYIHSHSILYQYYDEDQLATLCADPYQFLVPA